MKDVMIDLETLGQTPGCSILSIGAVFFDDRKLGNEFYVVANREDCKANGLREEDATLQWWGDQSTEARQVLKDAASKKESVPLRLALGQLTDFLGQHGRVEDVRIWGNGSDFDNAILAVAFFQLGLGVPWKFWNNRCFRTLKEMAPRHLKPTRRGTHHNALDDAKYQAEWAIRALRWLAAR